MEIIKRLLTFNDGIIDGDTMRVITEIFPETETSFTQRKRYDEYYYVVTNVIVSLEKLDVLSQQHYSAELSVYELRVKL